jgi:hypothetical protein
MHVLLDHISSVIVASLLFLSLIAVMHRSRQNTIELQVGQMIEEQAFSFARTVERDLENIRSGQQTLLALGRTEECLIERDGAGNTTRLLFPTLDRPDAGVASAIVHIEYRLVPDDTTTIEVAGTRRPVYRVERRRKINDLTYVDDGASGNFITRFDIGMVEEGAIGAPSGLLLELCPDNLDRVQVDFQVAVPTVEYESADKKSTTRFNVVRYGTTVYTQNR